MVKFIIQWLKKYWIFAIIGGAILLGLLLWVVFHKKRNTQNSYTWVEVQRGRIENTVSATGTLEPLRSVEVGTQVSGIIDKIFVDFNDRVTRNQLLAVLDTTLLSVQIREAKANLLRAQAQYDKAKYDFERTERLFKDGLLSELEYVTSKTNYESALSSLQSAQISLERAERNMRYAFIRSPIHGTVIYRKVEEGQTVASSFQTPMLFLIAEDLSKMEIHALVDESDIGLIKPGQSVRFNVQAYENKTFTGKVRQIWLQPQTVQNVVNYTVVIDAENPEGLLLPGMTADIEFIVEEKDDVLMVPSSALQIQPNAEMMAVLKKRMEERFGARSDSLQRRRGMGFPSNPPPGFGGGFPPFGEGSRPRNFAFLWYIDNKGELSFVPVRTGITNGKNTEIIPLRGEIKEGMKVIGGIASTEEVQTTQRPIFGTPGFGGPPRRM